LQTALRDYPLLRNYLEYRILVQAPQFLGSLHNHIVRSQYYQLQGHMKTQTEAQLLRESFAEQAGAAIIEEATKAPRAYNKKGK